MDPSNDAVKFFATNKGSRRVFSLRPEEITLKKLSLFSAIAADEIELRSPVENDVVNISQLVPNLPEPYEVVRVIRVAQKEWVDVCSELEFEERKNSIQAIRIGILGRDVLILKTRKGYRALDAVCYHYGGPLMEGSIEELPSGECVVICPWHRYRINVTTGHSQSGNTRMQRTHSIRIGENGMIQVFLDQDDSEIASDHYARMGLFAH